LDNKNYWFSGFYKAILNRSFILGAIIPFLIYQIGSRIYSGIIPSLVSTIYSCSYVVLVLIIRRKIDFFGLLSALLLIIIMITILIVKEDKYFIYKGLFDELVLFFIFGISLLLKKPIMQTIVEKLNNFSDEIKSLTNYKQIWKIETEIWFVYYFTWFFAQIVLLKYVSKQQFLTLQVIIGKLSFFSLLAFSYFYSHHQIRKSYIKEIRNIKEAN